MAESGSSGGTRGASAAPPAWLRNVAVWVGVALALVVLVVLGVAVLPPWWASLIGGWVDGVQSRGIVLGLVLGIVFTLLPIGLVLLALRSGLSSRARIALIVGALLLLLPSVLTIAIWAGSSDARSVLVIEAPGFRGATVIGIALVVVALVVVLVVRARSRRTRARITEAREKSVQVAREGTPAVEATPAPADPPTEQLRES